MASARVSFVPHAFVRVRRGLSTTCVLLTLLAPGHLSAQIADSITSIARFVTLDGARTRVVTLGLESPRDRGQPVIVLQAGSGSVLESWGEWLFDAAALGPVVAYDRPGLGESEMPEGWIASPGGEARQLRKLLTLLDVPPPYVLVGHSWGGTLILIYSGLFPTDVAGMVYIDPIPDAASTAAHRFGSSDPARLAELHEWEAERLREAWPTLSPGLRAAATAMSEFFDSPVESRGIPADLPVPTSFLLQVDPTVIDLPPIFGDGFVEAYIDRNIDRFSARVRANPSATLTLVGKSGHFIHRDRPELVTSALQWVLIRSPNPN